MGEIVVLWLWYVDLIFLQNCRYVVNNYMCVDKYIFDVLLKFNRCNFGCLLDDYIKEGKREFVKKNNEF